MTYIVNENCIKCKFTDCVEVCPVDCFYEGENMLVIHPDECIDCGVCEPECPVEAIKPDTEPGLEKWLELNRQYSEKWPNITSKKEAPPDADNFRDEKDKYQKYFIRRARNRRLTGILGPASGLFSIHALLPKILLRCVPRALSTLLPATQQSTAGASKCVKFVLYCFSVVSA